MSQEQEKGQLIRIGGLWLNESKSGKYMAGSLGGARVLVFRNTKKQKPNEPDYNLFIAPAQKKDGAGKGRPQDDTTDIPY